MSAMMQLDRPADQDGRGPWLGRALAAVILIPVFFAAAFALGYVLYDLFGYQPENDDAPFWVDVACTLPTLALTLVPCGAAVHYGRRAVRGGDTVGWVPVVLGVAAGLGLTVLAVLG